MRNNTILSLNLLLLLLLWSCQEEDETIDSRALYYKPVNPSNQPSELSRILQVEGENVLGNTPENNSTNSPQLLIVQDRASITPDNELFLPFTFQSDTEVERMYLLVQGADNYWNVPINPGENQGYVLDIGIPSNVMNGSFCLNYRLADTQGNIGNQKEIDVQVVPYEDGCDGGSYPQVKGSDGLSVRSYLFGDQPGTIQVLYETFSVPDRVDIRYGDRWVGVTGEPLNGSTPPIKQCDNVAAGDGFLGTDGLVEIDYNPMYSKRIDVYISGCLEGGTAWNFQVICPEYEEEEEEEMEDDFTDLPDCPCTLEELNNEIDNNDSIPGEWLLCGNASQTFHYGATTEARWAPDEAGAAGQQCTYDNEGRLITGGIAAGSPDRVSPRTCGSSDDIGSTASHLYQDVSTWYTNSCVDYLNGWPANDGNCNTQNVISGIDHMLELVGSMNCENITDIIRESATNENIPEQLRDYILNRNNSSYSTEQLIEWLDDWRDGESCNLTTNYLPSGLCSVITTAINNLEN